MLEKYLAFKTKTPKKGLGFFRRPSTELILGWFATGILFVLVGAPLLAVVLQAFFPGLLFGEQKIVGINTLLQIFERPLWRVSLINSLKLAVGSMVLGSIIGIGLALIRHSYQFYGRKTLDLTAWVLLIMPSFVVAQGWILFASRGGIANQWFNMEFVGNFIFSPIGLIVIMSLKNFPFAYLTVSAAMQWDVANYTNAAKLCGANPWRVLRTIKLPLLLPAVLSGMLLIFVDTLGDFGLPAALATSYRFPTLTYSIYVAISQAPIRFDLAGVLSFYLVGIIALAIFLNIRLMKNSYYAFLTGNAKERIVPKPSFANLLTIASMLFVVTALLVPIGTSALVSFLKSISAGPVVENLTMEYYYYIFFDKGSYFLEALSNSMKIAFVAAIAALMIGFLISYMMTFVQFKLNSFLGLASTVTLAVPGVILGVGFIFVWNQLWLETIGLNLYGRPIILVLAATAGAIPLVVRTTLGSFAQLPHSFLSAAALQGASLWRRLGTILIPLTMPSLLSAGLVSFGTCVFDLAVTSILRPPGYYVLPVFINRQFQMGNFGISTAATFFGTIVTVAIIFVIDFLVKRSMRNKKI